MKFGKLKQGRAARSIRTNAYEHDEDGDEVSHVERVVCRVPDTSIGRTKEREGEGGDGLRANVSRETQSNCLE